MFLDEKIGLDHWSLC